MTLFNRRQLLSAAIASTFRAPAAVKTRVVFVCGDHEYSGEITLPILAAELERSYGLACTVLKSAPDQNGETDIPGLEALKTADLAVFYLRWRQLPKEQVAFIDAYMRSGKPMMGFRTSSHAFNYPQGHELVSWNGWAAEAFGAPPGWGADGHTHFGHDSSTNVRIEKANAGHPILEGVQAPFDVRSWLYRVRPKWPPSDAKVLLTGEAVNPNKPAEENPVAWTWKNRHGGRVFFTTLGHPEDFAVEPVQRLTVNALHWCLTGRGPRRWRGPLAMHVPYRGLVKPTGKK
ncbi:MAG: ThuA domain-containing protein [Bryobacteraceae bacterium]